MAGDYTTPHIAITVVDVEETKNFYKAIGFELRQERYSKEKRRTFLLLVGYGIEIEIFCFDVQVDATFDHQLDAVGFQHVALPVPDLQAQRDFLLSKSILLYKDLAVSSSGINFLNILDPSGLIIEFFEAKS